MIEFAHDFMFDSVTFGATMFFAPILVILLLAVKGLWDTRPWRDP